MENFIVSARKYRPENFDSVVGQQAITKTLKNSVKTKQLAHAYLFCGPRGVGKTTCARIFAKTINCQNLTENIEACNECDSCKSINKSASYNIHELDAASNNSVDDIRQLIDQVRIPPQVGNYSVYIIDEVHMLSQAAFNAFLKTLEEPPKHAIFILATTEKHKIIPTILSRCQIFDFNRIDINDMVNHLKFIAEKEGVSADEEALNLIAQKADGALRDALSIFDQMVSFSGKSFGYKDVAQNLNVIDYEYYFKFVDYFISGNLTDTMLLINDIYNKGFDGQILINGLTKHIRDLLMCKDPETVKLLETSENVRNQFLQQSEKADVNLLIQWIDILNNADINYKQSNNKRLHTEIAFIKLCSLSGINLKTDKKISESKIIEKEEKKTEVKANPVKKAEKTEDKKQKPTLTPSIKNIKSGTTDSDSDTEDVKAQKHIEEKKEDFTQENLLEAWKEIAEKYKENPAHYALLQPEKIELTDNYTIDCWYASKTSKQTFEKELYNEVLFNLKQKLNNDVIKIIVKVIENQSNGTNKLYTDSDKLEYLKSKNPKLDTLQKNLKLDFK
ncbi:MAG: hypothetical protein Kow0068_14470 [Marinilabiliales bacterium]